MPSAHEIGEPPWSQLTSLPSVSEVDMSDQGWRDFLADHRR
jgi:hypothetical protein